tara:strand:+ start:178 stop:507 length:330 start_codon:yes stop_codon:yes gene_type:complete
MTNTVKVLGQSAPLATTLTVLYTVPALTRTTSSSIVICNRSVVDATFRVSVAVSGAADATKQYLYYDQAVEANSTFIATIGITLSLTDEVRVYASAADLSFNLFGVEVV